MSRLWRNRLYVYIYIGLCIYKSYYGCRKKAIVYKASISSDSNNLPNCTMDAAKRNINPVFTIIARLSRPSKKDIPPSYRKPSGKP